MTENTETDFDGCRHGCRRAGAHTLVYGECEHAPEPEPTVSLSHVYADTDGRKSIGFDTYTVGELADLIEPSLRRVQARFGPNALAMLDRGETVALSGGEYADLAREAAHAIVHRHDPAAVVVRVPDTSHTVREQLLDALDFSYCLGLGFETPEMLLAAYDASRTVPPAPADRAAVRPSTLHAIANHLEGRAVRVFRPEAEVYAEYHAVAAELRRMAAVPAAVSGRTDNETGATPVAASGPRANAAASAVGGAQPKEAGA